MNCASARQRRGFAEPGVAVAPIASGRGVAGRQRPQTIEILAAAAVALAQRHRVRDVLGIRYLWKLAALFVFPDPFQTASAG